MSGPWVAQMVEVTWDTRAVLQDYMLTKAEGNKSAVHEAAVAKSTSSSQPEHPTDTLHIIANCF